MITNDIIKLYQADIEDIECVIAIEIESHLIQDPENTVNQTLNMLLLQEYKKRWQQKLQSGMSILISAVNDQHAGFIAYSVTQDYAEIHNIYVISTLRRQQLGRLLCNHALEKIMKQSVSKVVVWLVEGRTQNIRFYENMGFIATSLTRIDRISDEVTLVEKKFEMIINH